MKILLIIYLAGFFSMLIPCVLSWAKPQLVVIRRARGMNASASRAGLEPVYTADIEWKELWIIFAESVFWFALAPFCAWLLLFEEN